MLKPYEIGIYRTVTGKEPYIEWEENLEKALRARIDARFARIREGGSLGICETVGEGVFELKFDIGPGYRVYFGLEKGTLMILLLGGSKKSQQKDINKAKRYWKDHLLSERSKNEKI